MARMQTDAQIDEQNETQDDFQPMTAEQAQAWRKDNPPLSVWRVVGFQVLVGLGVALATYGITGRASTAVSAAYGALAVVLPAALFARGVTSKVASLNAGAAVLGFFVWEMVKIALTVAMLFAATRVVPDLSWPAMLAGLIVTMKVYWVVLAKRHLFHPKV